MKNKKLTYNDLALKKEQMRLKVLEQEIRLKAGFREFSQSLSPVNLGNRLFSGLLQNPETAIKVGVFLVSLFKLGRSRRKKSRRS